MLILVGKSASGKTEIAKNLSKYNIEKIVTYTTRKKRILEVDKVDYIFLTTSEFKKLISEDFFFEYEVYNDNYYGTAKSDVSSNKVLIVEPKGLKNYKNSNFKIYSIFIKVDENIRETRMINRFDERDEIKKRLIKDSVVFNGLESLVDYVINFNGETIEELTEIVFNTYKNNFLEKNRV